MNVLCILSSFPGHIDFGGKGFLRVAEQLKAMGHRVTWLSSSSHTRALSDKGFAVVSEPDADMLRLHPFLSTEEVAHHPEEYSARLRCLSGLLSLLRRMRPDIVLLDRALPLAQLATGTAGIPCVAIGTPGGHWEKNRREGVAPRSGPIAAYLEVGESIRKSLGWPSGEISSFWANSDNLNICFMGQPFYQAVACNKATAAFVHHFSRPADRGLRSTFGVSFGNSGAPQPLVLVMQCLISQGPADGAIDVFVGNRAQLASMLKRNFGRRIRVHGWVDFSDHFPSLSGLAFLGGVGTIWQCINHGVPMLVVPSITGDQMTNGEAVHRLGVGEVIAADDTRDPRAVVEKANRLVGEGAYLRQIEECKREVYYTDTMQTLASRLEDIG